MRKINRRDLSHNSANILDQILDTGEPVEVTTRGRPSVIIAPKPESVYDRWIAQGLVKPGNGEHLDELLPASSPRSVDELLDAIASDH